MAHVCLVLSMSIRLGQLFSWRGVALAALLTGGYQLHQRFELDGLSGLAVKPRAAEAPDSVAPDESEASTWFAGLYPLGSGEKGGDRVRSDSVEATPVSGPRSVVGANANPRNLVVGTWALNGFGPEQLGDETVMPIFASVVRNFDVIALQQVRVSQRDFLDRLVARLNRDGRQYETLSTNDLNVWRVDGAPEHLVFLYDTRRVVADRTQLYRVADPEKQLRDPPLVAWFRAAQPDPQLAWTFSLVNVRVDLSRARQEIRHLGRLAEAVAGDGRGEDDVILAGLFQADHAYLGSVMGERKYWIANQASATDVDGRHQTSNLIINRRHTTESLMRSGVIDFLRVHNLSIEHAKRVSPYLPVYAEFSPWEG